MRTLPSLKTSISTSAGSELNFIVTDTDATPIRMQLRNRGGHDARDFFAYVTFGESMVVANSPGNCSESQQPAADAGVDRPGANSRRRQRFTAVTSRSVRANQTRNFNFEIRKNPNANVDDDLTLRADVIGEITLNDGTLLTFPTVQTRGDGITDRANNYSIDSVRARVIGYNLTKEQQGTCSENNPPPNEPGPRSADRRGMRIPHRVGWLVRLPDAGLGLHRSCIDMQVVDNLPNGQGWISATDPFASGYSTGQIQGVSLNPPPQPLDEAPFDWTHNQNDPAERITVKDHWFRVDTTTRLLNDPQDQSAPPNQHANPSRNVLTSSFDGVFMNPLTSEEEVYTFDTGTVGYPPEFRRAVDLTVTEPNIIITKEVCNETDLSAIGPSCSNFQPLVDDGDAFDTYVFKRDQSRTRQRPGGVTRAPAYDVTVFSDLDSSDLSCTSIRFDADGLDNDGDGEIDEAGGEGSIVPDNITRDSRPRYTAANYYGVPRIAMRCYAIDAGARR